MACIFLLLLYFQVCFPLEVQFETEDNQIYEVEIPDETEDNQDFEVAIPKKYKSYHPTIANRRLPNDQYDKGSLNEGPTVFGHKEHGFPYSG